MARVNVIVVYVAICCVITYVYGYSVHKRSLNDAEINQKLKQVLKEILDENIIKVPPVTTEDSRSKQLVSTEHDDAPKTKETNDETLLRALDILHQRTNSLHAQAYTTPSSGIEHVIDTPGGGADDQTKDRSTALRNAESVIRDQSLDERDLLHALKVLQENHVETNDVDDGDELDEDDVLEVDERGLAKVSTKTKVCRTITKLTSETGTITSPSYPHEYPGNTNCKYRIKGPKGKIIRLRLLDIGMEADDNCPFDKLVLFDGKNRKSKILGDGPFCGFAIPDFAFVTTGNVAFIQFRSDANVGYSGFKLQYEIVSKESSCATRTFDKAGSAHSEGYSDEGKGAYDNDMNCTWIITAPEPTLHIRLRFEDFDVEKTDDCESDQVSLRDGDNSESQLIGKYCGRELERTFNSTGPSLFINMISDESYSGNGIKFSWIFVEKIPKHPACGSSDSPHVLKDTEGVINSPVGPDGINYPDFADCAWRVVVPKDQVVNLHFDYFHVEDSADCEFDRLTVYDGGSDSKPLLDILCGQTLPSDLISRTNKVYLTFKTDRSTTKPGFRIKFAGKEKSESSGLCGVSMHPAKGKIVGGERVTQRHAYPWHASLRNKHHTDVFSEQEWGHWCGASIVTDTWVITAAHCVFGITKDYLKLRFGEHDQKVTEGDEFELEIAEILIHENYDADSYNNDIAMLKVTGEITFSDVAQPICLAHTDPKENTICTTSGWGTTDLTLESDILNQVRIPVWDHDQCRQTYESDGYNFTDNMICAGMPAKDACQGDSGGPFMCHEKGRYYLSGITSWGLNCGDAHYPGVYTRVTRYLDWIDNIIAAES